MGVVVLGMQDAAPAAEPLGAPAGAPEPSEPAARRSARRPAPRAKQLDEELADAGARGRSAGKQPRSLAKRTPNGSPQGSDAEPDGAQPQRKRFRQLVFSHDADGAPDGAAPPPSPPADGGAGDAGPGAALPGAAGTPVSRKRPAGGAGAGSAGKGGAGRRTHGPRKSHGLEDEELLKAKGKGRRAPAKPQAEPAPPPAEPRAGAVCRHTDCEPSVQPVYAHLSHLLCARPRRWAAYEWFYAAIDLEFFKPAESEFQACLSEAGLAHVCRLTRREWSFVRSLVGRPRRLSAAYLAEERQRLHEHRARARQLGCARLAVGQSVTAFHPRVRQLHLGTILTPDGEAYRVQFDRAELGVQLVPDFLIVPHEPAHAGGAGAGAGASGLGGLGAEAYAALREHHAMIGMGIAGGLGGPSLAALRSLDALSAAPNGAGAGAGAAAAGLLGRGAGQDRFAIDWAGAHEPFAPSGAGGTPAEAALLAAGTAGQAAAADAATGGAEPPPSAEHRQLAGSLSALLERKALLVRELRQTNDEVEAGTLPLELGAVAGQVRAPPPFFARAACHARPAPREAPPATLAPAPARSSDLCIAHPPPPARAGGR